MAVPEAIPAHMTAPKQSDEPAHMMISMSKSLLGSISDPESMPETTSNFKLGSAGDHKPEPVSWSMSK